MAKTIFGTISAVSVFEGEGIFLGIMMNRIVQVGHPLGFHMRPKAAFAETANRFQSDIQVIWEGKSINGKSMWDLMLVGATQGAKMILEAAGPDAQEALDALAFIIESPKLLDEID